MFLYPLYPCRPLFNSIIKFIFLTSEFWESVLHEAFNSNTLILGDSRRQTESLDGSSDTNSKREKDFIRFHIALIGLFKYIFFVFLNFI